MMSKLSIRPGGFEFLASRWRTSVEAEAIERIAGFITLARRTMSSRSTPNS